jgi:hypothetical protein
MNKQSLKSIISGSGMILVALVFVLASCSKKDENLQTANSVNQISLKSTPQSTCNTLIAGQNTPVGQVCVTDDGSGQLLVEYIADADYSFTQIHFWYGYDFNGIPKNKSGNPVPGKFPYKFSFEVPQDYFSFYVPYLEGWTCGTSFYIAAHSVFGTETAWGQGSPIVQGNGNWGMYYQATPQCPIIDDDGDECENYQTATAFGGNSTGAGNSWWYYYETSEGGVQELYAGQTFDAGSVEFNAGTLTITLEDGWELSPVSEPVKVQGYQTLPNKRPAAGLFTTYKGSSLIIENLESFNYFVIHLDVRKCADQE